MYITKPLSRASAAAQLNQVHRVFGSTLRSGPRVGLPQRPRNICSVAALLAFTCASEIAPAGVPIAASSWLAVATCSYRVKRMPSGIL